MSLRIVLGILILGYAIRLSRNLYKTLKQSQSGIERTHLFGVNVDLETGPLSAGKRVVYLILMLPINLTLYIFALLVFFNITFSNAVSFITRFVK